MGGEHLDPLWRYKVYFELAYGYEPYKETDEMHAEVKGYLATPLVLRCPMGKGDYLYRLG